MKYGAMNFPVRPTLEEARRIGELGFDYFELTLDPPMAHWSDISRIKKDLCAVLEEFNLGIICHLPTFVYTADLSPEIRTASLKEMERSILTAAEAGAQKAVLHPSMVTGLGSFVLEDVKNLAKESLIQLTDCADSAGIQLCFENMFPRYQVLYEPEEFEAVFKEFTGLALCLDTGHAHIKDPGNQRLFNFIKKMPEKIGHVHISDNKGKRDEHLRVGKGTIDFKRFIFKLVESGYNDTITLEIFSSEIADLIKSKDRITRFVEKSFEQKGIKPGGF